MILSLDSIIVQSEGQVAAEIDGEIVTMSVESGKYYNLDRIGSYIWKKIDRPIKVADLCDLLQSEFAVEPDVCKRDVLGFLGSLADRHLISDTAG